MMDMDFDIIRENIRYGIYDSDEDRFRLDVLYAIIQELSIPDVAAAVIFGQAWEDGHSAGYGEVLTYAIQHTEMVKTVTLAKGGN